MIIVLLITSCSWTLVESRNKALVWFLNESYDDRMVAVLKDSVDVPILYCSSLKICFNKWQFVQVQKMSKIILYINIKLKKNSICTSSLKRLKTIFLYQIRKYSLNNRHTSIIFLLCWFSRDSVIIAGDHHQRQPGQLRQRLCRDYEDRAIRSSIISQRVRQLCVFLCARRDSGGSYYYKQAKCAI